MKFNGQTQFSDLKEYEGSINPTVDLKDVKKEVLLLYIAHLDTEIRARDISIDKLTDTFERTIVNITQNCTNSGSATIIQKLDELAKTPPTVAETNNTCDAGSDISEKLDIIHKQIENFTASNIHNQKFIENDECVLPPAPPAVLKPYEVICENFIADKTEQQLLKTFVENLEYTPMGDQRSVCYFGEYKYKYTGGFHKETPIPSILDDLRNTIHDRYPTYSDYRIVSFLISKYSDGTKYCPSHSDDEWSIGPKSFIFTLSIGGGRPMEFQMKKHDGTTELLHLNDNSLLIFSRVSQAIWRHGIPIDDLCTGERYSITMRANMPYFMNSTALIGDSNTKDIKFGDKIGHLGKWVPGERIKASTIENIPPPHEIGPYRNIIIHTGINNINRNHPRPVISLEEQLEAKCIAIHEMFPKTRIYISPLLPTRKYHLNVKVSQFNESLVSIAKRHHNIYLMDNSIFLDSQTYLLKHIYASDKGPDDIVHLGARGIRLFASSIKSYALGRNPLYPQNFSRALQRSP